MYMHIAGHGDPVKLAAALRQALSASRTPLAAPQSPSASAAASRLDLDVAALNRLMGGEGKTAGGILQYSFPRAERLMDGDMETPPTMGPATAINYQPTGDGRAAITGDLVQIGRARLNSSH